MSPLLDDILVAAALLTSAVYALYALGPRSLRQGALARLAGWAGRMPGWFGLRGFAARLGAAAAQSPGACGGCDNCGSEGNAARASPGRPASTPASAAGASSRTTEIKVPLASIGRRQ